MCQFNRVTYIEACGHYCISALEKPEEVCAQAKEIVGRWGQVNYSPCAAVICELEAQRKGRWSWTATVNGVEIRVYCQSSGHCDAWQKKGFKRIDYKALAKEENEENTGAREDSGPGTSTSESGDSADTYTTRE